MFRLMLLVFALMISLATAEDWSWIPRRVPTASQQCIHHHLRGLCSNAGRAEHHPQICKGIYCVDHEENLKEITPLDGTICGQLNVCWFGKCLRIPIKKFPKEYGSRASFPCCTP